MNRKLHLLTTLCTTLCALASQAAVKYWDIDGATPGAGGSSPSGDWNITTPNWSTDSTGSSAGTTFTAGDAPVFSAGTDATGLFSIAIPTTVSVGVGGAAVEEGSIELSGAGAMALGTNSLTIQSGAKLSIPSVSQITASSGSKVFLNAGTLENKIDSTAGPAFIATAITNIVLTGGGTLSSLNFSGPTIINTNTVISGAGPLKKAGGGILAVASACTYTGNTEVNEGTLRVRSTSNRLPTGTAVIIAAGATLDPGSTSGMVQRVASVEGDGGITFTASSTLLMTFASGTKTLGGVISDPSIGSTLVYGRMSKTGAGTLELTGANNFDGRWTNSTGTITVKPGGALIGDAGDVYLESGTINLNNDFQTIENLSGGSAAAVLNLNGTGSPYTLTMNIAFNSTYAGIIAGIGGITVNNGNFTNVLTLSGNTTYSGATEVGSGTLVLAGNKSGNGTITVSGVGNLKVTSSTNTCSGATAVNSGRLWGVTGGSLRNSTVTVAAGATNMVQVATANGAYTNGAMTFNTSSVLEFQCNAGISLSTTVAPLQLNGGVDFTGGQPTVNIMPASAIPAGGPVTYPLVAWSGSMTGTFADTPILNLGGAVTATVRKNAMGTGLELYVESNKEPLTWATGNATWDTTTANWKDATLASAVYTEVSGVGDQVVFEDTLSGAGPNISVDLGSTFYPATLLFTNNTKSYTFTGSGSIAGSIPLVKKGTGKLTLACLSPQTYSGGTDIQGGTLQLGNGSQDCSVQGDINTAASTVIGVSNVNALTIGNLGGAGKLIKGGAGTLTLTSGATTTLSGGQDIYDGTLYSPSTATMMAGPITVNGASAKMEVLSSGAIGSTAVGAGDITLNGGSYQNDYAATAGATFLTANRSIKVGTTATLPMKANDIFLYQGTLAGVTAGSGTLTITAPAFGYTGELRCYPLSATVGAHNTFGKLILDGGWFTVGHGTSAGYEDTYGAVPASFTADMITIQNGGMLRQNVNTNILNANRGIKMGTGGGVIRAVTGSELGIPGIISGSGPLMLGGWGSDAGAINLAGANTFSGGLTLFRGTIAVNNAQAFGAASSTVTIGTNAITLRNTTSGPITLVNNNPMVWIATSLSFIGTNDVNLGTGAVTLGTNVTVTTSSKTLTVGGAISGDFSLTKAGTSTLALGGTSASSYSGGTTLSAGTLDVSKDGGLGSGNVTVASGATLKLSGGTANTYINSGATLTLNGAAPSVALNFTGTPNTIGALYFGTSQMPAGTWGAIGSGANHQSALFTGTGTLNVASGVAVPQSTTNAILSVASAGAGAYNVTLQGTVGAEYLLLGSSDVTTAQASWTSLTASMFAPSPSGQWTIAVTNAAPRFLRLKAVDPAP